ncbi:MAG TPA: PD-(D/E)XK nuclease superfamily protein [Pyrinomonadaceae bacterium]|nr:PD-(D/E)XK nuclease superfamily protein [Pyrinomonadaceae bacterium]
MPRDTRTGGVLEAMILPSLARGGYEHRVRVKIGQRLGCGSHYVDAIAEKDGRKLLISSKWQQSGGTAEQKIPFEVICLVEALQTGEYGKAYIVLGGEGWTLRKFYTSGVLSKYIRGAENVEIMSLEGFVAKANRGEL